VSSKPKKVVYQTLQKFGVDVRVVTPRMKISTIIIDPLDRIRFAKALTAAMGTVQVFNSSKLAHASIRDVVISANALPGDITKRGRPR
jgi:hypothetical protein